MAGSSGVRRWADAALTLVLFATTVLYLASLPRNLGPPDEAHMLHQAKRLLGGEVMYRDIFNLITPGWMYLMAALFDVFGTTLTTARITAAVLHGCTAVLVFSICRRLGLRRALAWACGFAHLAVSQPIFPEASYHWLATFLCVALLALCVRSVRGPLWHVVLGAVLGLLIAVHQQRGISMGLGVVAFLVADAIILRRVGGRPVAAALAQQLLALAGGVLLVVLPLLACLVFSAGLAPVWDALVVYPLVNYRGALSFRWGFAWGRSDAVFTIAHLMKHLPVVLAFSITNLLVLYVRRQDLQRARDLALLTAFCLSAIVSIMYLPDIFHIAIIAPILFIAIADSVEWGLRLLPRGIGRGLGYAIALAIVLGGALELQRLRTRLQAQFPVAYASAFGRVDLAGDRHARLLAQLDELLRTVPSRTLYCHPMSWYTYLLVDARNPTRFSFVIPPVLTSSAQMQEIAQTLAEKRIPYVVLDQRNVNVQHDPVARYIREHYEQVRSPMPLAQALWRRRAESAAGAAAPSASEPAQPLPP